MTFELCLNNVCIGCGTIFNFSADDDRSLFTLKVHHSGALKETQGILRYSGGKVSFIDWLSKDYISLLDLNDLADKLGYDVPINFYHKIDGGDNGGSFVVILNDKQLVEYLKNLGTRRVANIYVHINFVPLRVIDVSSKRPFDPTKFQHEAEQEEDPNLHEVNTEFEEASAADEVEDSEFEESDVEEGYMPSTFNDPTKTWASFKQDVAGNEHVLTDSEDSREFSSDSSEEEDTLTVGRSKKRKCREFNPVVDMTDPEFTVGMVFPTVDVLKKAIKEHALKSHRAIRLVKNDRVRIRAKCEKGCPWMLFASVVPRTSSYMIKTMNYEHTCILNFEGKKLRSRWLCEKYLNHWKANPNWTFASFEQQVRDDLKIDPTRWHYYRAKKMALKLIEGSVKEQYSRLWDYCEALRSTNPGSTIKMMCDSQQEGQNAQFQRLYVCMDACKKGFKAGCRRIIGLDGCFVKGPHRGQLLAAVGIDPNNAIYPIAFAVVESECFDSWDWFMGFLIEDLEINNSNGFTFMSDRQKGLIEAVKKHCSESPHRFCVRHLYNNFKVQHKGLVLKQSVWNIARATTEARYTS